MIAPDQLIVDCSIAIKWVIQEPGSNIAMGLLSRDLVAPDLLYPECANALGKMTRRGELSADEALLAARTLERFPIEVVSARSLITSATQFSIQFGHPAYDCVYLAVIERLSIPLVTADERLARRVSSIDQFRERVIPLSALNDEAAP